VWDDAFASGFTDARLVSSLDHDLRQAGRYIEALDRRTLRAVTPPLTPAQYHLLAASTVPGSAGEIARRLGCDPGNVSGLIARLESQGLLACSRDAADRRRVIVALTPGGRAALAMARQARLAALVEVIGDAEMMHLDRLSDQMRWLLGRLQQAAEMYPGE
jgi:DNA-binding MarR family transcriptional regulator